MRGHLRSALLGAAGTSALNVVAHPDMAVQGRPASSTPEDTVKRMSALHVPVPRQADDRAGRHRPRHSASVGLAR